VVCDCPHGFIGLTCEIKFDLCENILCHNNGTCVTKLSNFECECPSGFSGEFCENTENVTSTIMPSTSISVKPQTINTTTETVTNATGSANITDVVESQSNNTDEVTSKTTSVVTTVATETTTKSHITAATETTTKSHITLATETTTKSHTTLATETTTKKKGETCLGQ